MMNDRTIKYRLFHLIKDVSEGIETTQKVNGKEVMSYTNIKRRYFLKYFSWILEIDTWTRVIDK